MKVLQGLDAYLVYPYQKAQSTYQLLDEFYY